MNLLTLCSMHTMVSNIFTGSTPPDPRWQIPGQYDGILHAKSSSILMAHYGLSVHFESGFVFESIPIFLWFVDLCFTRIQLVWDCMVMIVLIWTCIEVPFTLAFNIDLTLNMPLGVVSFCIDCFLLMDVLVNFRTAYFDSMAPFTLIISEKEIAKHYAKTWFIVDLFTSLPFEFMLPNNSGTKIVKLFRIFRLLRLFKLLRFFRMLRTFNNVLRAILTRSVVVTMRLVRIILLMMLFTHYFACIYWWIGQASLTWGYEESWINNDRWDLLDGYTRSEQYIKCFYFSLAQVSTVGFGDIHPINAYEEFVCCIVFITGTCFFGWFLSAVAQIAVEGDVLRAAQNQKIAGLIIFRLSCISN